MTDADHPIAVLFLCTGNSARSILAEALLNALGNGALRAYSAGSHPKGEVHPLAIELLKSKGFATDSLRSKGWEEFETASAPRVNVVITVCNSAAEELCPVWPGAPLSAHWGIPDPAAEPPDRAPAAFRAAFDTLEARIRRLVSLPFGELDRTAVAVKLREIGRS